MTFLRLSLRLTLSVAALLLFSGVLAPAQAQSGEDAAPVRSNTKGLSLNAHLDAASITLEDQDRRSGGGFGLEIGYGITSRLAIFAGIDGDGFSNDERIAGADSSEDFGLGYFDLGAQYQFASARRALVPYLSAALTARALVVEDTDSDDDVRLSGGGVTLGGGLRYYVSPSAAIDLGGGLTLGRFTDLDNGNDGRTDEEIEIDARSVRLGVGLTVYPFR